MKLLKNLYIYEWKKLLQKKIVWITVFISVLILIVSLLSYFISPYEGTLEERFDAYQLDKEYSMVLDGRKIDHALLSEIKEAYKNIPYTKGIDYTITEEYQQYARRYSTIFRIVRGITKLSTSELILSWEPEEDKFYEERRLWMGTNWEDLKLSSQEKEFWEKKEEQVEKPIVYRHHEAYLALTNLYQTVGYIVLLVIAICLSGLFPEEYMRKTDQIILSSPMGKTMLYRVKIIVGVSFALLSSLFFSTIIFAGTFLLYGVNGFFAAFQLIAGLFPCSLTCGQAVLIMYGLMVMAAVTSSIFVMVISEIFCSNIGALALFTVALMIGMMVEIPRQYRGVSQLWNWLPWCYISPFNVFEGYTISVFGQNFTSWQALPVIYLLAAVGMALLGKRIYQKGIM